MEYNKDNAVMAMKDAESKILEKDFMGAKKSALEAQSLYPGLDGISQMLEIVDVLLAGERKINEKEDWYAVLGVSPTADDGELRRQYLKWSLKLHPDKNGSIGAEAAFKLICAAYKLLIDKEEREIYNEKTIYSSGPAPWWAKQAPAHAGGSSAPPPPSSYTAPAQNVPPAPPRQTGEPSMQTHSGGSSAPPPPAPAQNVPRAPPRQTGEPSTPTPPPPAPAKNVPRAPPRQTGEPSTSTHPGGSSMASGKFSTKSRNRKGKGKVPVTPDPPTTFSTICHTCRYRFEFPRKFLRCSLMCTRCSKPFQAVEMDRPRPARRQRKT